MRKITSFIVIFLVGSAITSPIIITSGVNIISNNEIDMKSNNGLVGEWLFEEGYGNYAYDTSGYNNHGEIIGAKFTSEGYSGHGLSFDGEWDYVLIQDNPSINFADTNQYTLDLWVKWDNTPKYGDGNGLINKRYSGGYNIQLHGEGSDFGKYSTGLRYMNNDGTTGDKEITSNTILQNQEWYHITVIWDGNTLYNYINGELDNSVFIGDVNHKDSLKPLELGNNWGYTDNDDTFKGILDEVRIYETAVFPELTCEIKIKEPQNQQIISSNKISIGGVTTSDLENISKVEIQLGENSKWMTATGISWWAYEADISDFEIGEMEINARCVTEQGDIVALDSIVIHIDKNNYLPIITIDNPNSLLSDRYYYDVVTIEGHVNDNDNIVDCVQIRIIGAIPEWEDVYLSGTNWLYNLDSKSATFENGASYELEFRCKDDELNIHNEHFYSPIETITLTIDNELPNMRLITPRSGHLYFFWNMFRIERYLGPNETVIIGNLPIQVEISNPEVLKDDWVDIIINKDRSHADQALDNNNDKLYEDLDWNTFYPKQTLCKLEVVAYNNHLHMVNETLDYIDMF